METMTAATPPTTKNKQKSHGSKRRKQPSSQPPFSLASGNDSTVDDVLEGVADLLKDKKNIVVLVGAGISTSVGIPDFRSKDKGLYNTLDAHALGLSCPEDLFCIEFFRDNPVPFYKFATNLYYPNQMKNGQSSASAAKNDHPKVSSSRASKRLKTKPNGQSSSSPTATNGGMAQPSDSHKLLALLEQRKKLLRVYTQNIDGLESTAGVSDSKIVYCHGSLKFMSCTRCSKRKVPLDENVLGAIRVGSVPRCRVVTSKSTALAGSGRSPTRTSSRTKPPRSVMTPMTDEEDDGLCGGVLKPGITFFGETLDHSVSRKIESDQTKADALIVIGTSLSVAPISKVIEYLPRGIPRILVNRNIVHLKTHEDDEIETENFRKNYVFDAYLLGFCDDVTRALGKQLGLTKNNNTKRTNDTTSKKRKPARKDLPQNHKHASATGAKLLTSLLGSETESLPSSSSSSSSIESIRSNEWSSVTVPKDRVILFPGALPSAAPTLEEPREVYHEVAHCDGCSQEISQGKPVYKCSKCFDFDLCQKCYPKVSKVHCNGTHAFRMEQ